MVVEAGYTDGAAGLTRVHRHTSQDGINVMIVFQVLFIQYIIDTEPRSPVLYSGPFLSFHVRHECMPNIV